MNLESRLVGTPLKNYQTEIDWRETTNYAAAVQDNNPKYFDDMEEESIVSHPMFPVSVTWPVLSRLDQFIDSPNPAHRPGALDVRVNSLRHLLVWRHFERGAVHLGAAHLDGV